MASDDRAAINALAQKLEQLEQRRKGKQGSNPVQVRASYRDASRGMKIATEFVAAVFIGAFLGWGIDWLFGTLPWFMLLFFCLGTVAGFLNAYRAALGREDDRFAGYELFGIRSGAKRGDNETGPAAGRDRDNNRQSGAHPDQDRGQ